MLWGKPRYIFFNLRDKTYLNWRFFENPDTYQVMIARSGQEYLGYAVTKLSKNGKAAIICDFITVDDRLDVFQGLIEAAERRLKNTKIQNIRIRCVKGSLYHRALIELGYFEEDPDNEEPIIVYSGTGPGKKLLETPGQWFFTYADSDAV